MTGSPWRRFVERLVLMVAGRLSPERGEALIVGAKAGYAVLTGRRPRRGTHSHKEPRLNPLARRNVESAIARADLPRAVTLLDSLLRQHPDSTIALRRRSDVLGRMGEMSERAVTMHRLHLVDEQPEWRDAERRQLGRIIETTPGWLPSIPGPSRPVVPVADSVVLNLLKESSPHLTNGFTMRSRYNLLAAAAAGVRPVVVTALGFPRLLGVTAIEPTEMVDGIPHHRLDLGPHYPLDRPADLLLEDQAWLITRLAHQVRPAVVHVSSGHRGFEFALIGQALRAHIRRPFVYEVRSFFESTWAGEEAWGETGEQYRRRFETETRAMQAADHVITIAEAMRDEIIERGVSADRITVVPNGVDTEVFRPEPPDPVLRQRYGLDGYFTFGYVSNLDHPRENQELMIAATKILIGRGRRVRCLIVGGGARQDELERLARRADVGRSVIFTGRVPHDEVRGHYALLNAFVVPRKDERAARMVTPLKPYEALAMGIPLIVARLPALVEIAEPDVRGLAFPPDDAEGLATAIERLMDDPELAARIGSVGREWVTTERRWVDNGPRFRDVYQRVLEEWADRHRPAA